MLEESRPAKAYVHAAGNASQVDEGEWRSYAASQVDQGERQSCACRWEDELGWEAGLRLAARRRERAAVELRMPLGRHGRLTKASNGAALFGLQIAKPNFGIIKEIWLVYGLLPNFNITRKILVVS